MKLCSVCKQRIPVALLKSGERICDECVIAQLAAAEKRASKAERMASEIRPYEQMLAKALLKAFDRIGIEIVHNALGSDASWVRNDLQTLAETNLMPARAQAVAEVLAVLHQTERRDYLYGGSVAINAGWFGDLMRAYNKLAALDGNPKPEARSEP